MELDCVTSQYCRAEQDMELEHMSLREVVNEDKENSRKKENRAKKEKRRKSRTKGRDVEETDLNNASEKKDNIVKENRLKMIHSHKSQHHRLNI